MKQYKKSKRSLNQYKSPYKEKGLVARKLIGVKIKRKPKDYLSYKKAQEQFKEEVRTCVKCRFCHKVMKGQFKYQSRCQMCKDAIKLVHSFQAYYKNSALRKHYDKYIRPYYEYYET